MHLERGMGPHRRRLASKMPRAALYCSGRAETPPRGYMNGRPATALLPQRRIDRAHARCTWKELSRQVSSLWKAAWRGQVLSSWRGRTTDWVSGSGGGWASLARRAARRIDSPSLQLRGTRRRDASEEANMGHGCHHRSLQVRPPLLGRTSAAEAALRRRPPLVPPPEEASCRRGD